MNEKHIEKIKKNKNLVVPTTCIIGLFLGVEIGGLQYALLCIAQEYSLSNATMGTLVSSQFVAILICPLIVGRLSDIIGKKIIIIAFSIIFAMGSGIIVIAPSMAIIVIGIFIVGLGFGAVENSATAALSDVFGSKSGKYISIMQCVLSVGAVISPIATSYAINTLQLNWRFVFVVCAVAFIVVAVVSFFTSFQASEETKMKLENHQSDLKNIFSVVMVCLLLSVMAYISLENGATFFFNSYFTEVLKAPEFAALSISAFWLAMAVSRFFGSFLYGYQKRVIVVCFAVSVVLMLSIPFINSALVAVGICFIMGIFYGPIWPFLMSIANEEFPKDTGTVSSLMLAAGGIGGAGIPVVIGAIADKSGITMGFVFLSVVGLAGMLLCICYNYKVKHRI